MIEQYLLHEEAVNRNVATYHVERTSISAKRLILLLLTPRTLEVAKCNILQLELTALVQRDQYRDLRQPVAIAINPSHCDSGCNLNR